MAIESCTNPRSVYNRTQEKRVSPRCHQVSKELSTRFFSISPQWRRKQILRITWSPQRLLVNWNWRATKQRLRWDRFYQHTPLVFGLTSFGQIFLRCMRHSRSSWQQYRPHRQKPCPHSINTHLLSSKFRLKLNPDKCTFLV